MTRDSGETSPDDRKIIYEVTVERPLETKRTRITLPADVPVEMVEAMARPADRAAPPGGWSDRKNWVMGVVGALLVAFLGWLATAVYDYSSIPTVIQIRLAKPADGTVFNHYPRQSGFSWTPVDAATRYVVEVQIQDPASGTWHPHPSESRLVSRSPGAAMAFVGAQSGRWRVQAFGEEQFLIGESAWWYFRFSR